MNQPHLLCLFCFSLVNVVVSITPTKDELLRQDPSRWPGHLEPFGSKQNISEGVEEMTEWPDPTTFFTEYVGKSRPALFKGLAKRSPGFTKFSDDYFKSAYEAERIIIYAEPERKENRTKKGFRMSIKEFVERYHDETLYMVDRFPDRFSHDVLMPAPLRCESTRMLMEKKVTWLSGGGTKSVLHLDTVDNINCLFRGTKQFWLIEHKKNKPYIPIDRPNGYSSLDVEKVDYTAFPELRKVDVYHRVTMDAGDCLFIPYHWYHQVNSEANHEHVNLAVNIWFTHETDHVPTDCDIPENEATLDKWEFGDSNLDFLKHFSKYTQWADNIRYHEFVEALKVDLTVNPNAYDIKDSPKKLKRLAGKLFNTIDLNGDGKISKSDWDELPNYDSEKVDMVKKTAKKYVFELKQYFLKLTADSKQLFSSENAKHHDEIRDEF